MKNFQQKLHEGPNLSVQPNDDVITKEEFEFKPLIQFQRPLKLIQRLSGLTSLFAICQLAYSGLSFSYLPSSFNLASTIMGLLSLILSIFLVIWSTKALKVERDKTLLTQDMIDRALEKISRIGLISLVIRVAVSCVMIPMMASQGTQTSEHLWAYDSTHNMPRYSAVADTLDNLSIPLPFLELFTCMTFMYAAWTCFRYVKSPSQLVSNLVSVSNIALMASSLTLVFNTLSVERNFENLLVPSLMPQWNVTGLKYAGILGGVMTGFIWLVNSKKWRVPSLLMTGLMTALVLSVGVLTVNSYNSANSISEFYQDTTDMNIWSFKMWNVDQKDIEAFGCPAKYLPSQKCQGSVLINRWEQTPADNKSSYCLNIACSDILGSLYSSPFLQMSNWALASVVSGLIVIAGSLYLSMTRFRDTAPRSKKDYGWLGVLIAMAIIFTVAVNTYTSPSIHEKGLSMEGLFQGEEKQMRSQGYDKWFGGSEVQMDSDLSRKVNRMFLLKENRFIRMRLNKDYDQVLLTQAGDYSLQYQDLIENLNPYRAEVALARVPLDSKHDAIVGIVWIPPAISPTERETYLRYYAVDQSDPRLGFPVYVATDKESLNKDIVLPNVFKYRTVFLEDEYAEVNEQDLIIQRQEMMTAVMQEIPAELNLAPEDGQELLKMIISKTYKFIVVGLDIENQKATIQAKGDWQSTYNDFVQNFRAGEAKVGLIYVDVEGESKLVVVIFENDELTAILDDLNVDAQPDIEMLQEMGIYLYFTNDPAELSIDSVMNGISEQGQLQQEMMQLIEVPNAKKNYKYLEKLKERFQLNLAANDVQPDLGLEIFNLIADQKYKFLLQRYNAGEKKVELVGTGQWNQSDYNTFVKLIKPNEPQVGYIFLELEGEKRLVLLVYAPKPTYSDPQTVFKMFNLPSDPRRLESIGVHVYIAHKQSELNIENVLSSIFGDDSQLRKLLQQMQLEDYLVQKEMNFRMLAVETKTQSQTGNAILDDMVNKKTYKYVLIKQNPATNGTYIAKSGDWNSKFNNFVQDVERGQVEVGLFYFQLETVKKLVLITYVPLNTGKTAEQVLTEFKLPSGRKQLAQHGISLYNSISKDDLQVKKILRSAYTNVPTVMSMLEILLEEDEDNTSGPLTSADMTSTGPRTTGKPGKGPVETEQMDEIIRDKDTVNMNLAAKAAMGEIIRSRPGETDGPITSSDVSPIAPPPPPRTSRPGDAQRMDEIIREQNSANMNLAANDNDEPDGPLTSADMTSTGPRTPTGKPGKGPVETEQMDEIIRDKDTVGLNLAANDNDEPDGPLTSADMTSTGPRTPTGKPGKGPVETEQMDEIIRDKDTISMNLAAKAAMEEIIRNKGDASTNFLFGFGKMGLDLSRDIVKPLKSKQVKYIILKQDPQNNGKVYIASNGTWYATFEQFVKEFEPNVPQVGFIYLEIEGDQKLVMVVYSPEGDAKQVVKDFKVTSKDAAKLKKKGIFTFTLNDLADLTVENAMNSVYSQENQPIIKMMQLMELYSDEPEMLYDINIDEYVSDREQAEMMLLDKKGLKLDRDIIQTIMSKDNKYTIVTRDANGVLSVSKTGTWLATFDQFVRDFAPTDDQLGFINLEIEQTNKLVMVVYAPNSPDKTDEQIFSDFGAAKNIEKLEKNDVSVYFARILGNINLDMILNKAFNVRNPTAIAPVITLSPNISALNLPVDIADGIQNQKYKYVVLQHDQKKDITSVQVSGDWGTEYKKFIKDFSGKKDQIAFTYLDIESKPRLVLVIFSDKSTPIQILRNFGLPDNEAALQEAGIQVYVARKKKDLAIIPLLEGIYSQDTFNANVLFFEVEANMMMMFEESDLPLGKDIVDALTNKKYKYMILQHDVKTDTISIQSTGNWGSTYKDFLKDFTKKDKQIGFIFIEAEAKEILVMIVYAPKVAGTQTLREFGLPDNIDTLNNIGIKPYIAHNKKELEFNKVLEGVYSSGTFEQNNPVVF